MKLVGENATFIEISKKSPASDLMEISFSCEWCAGRFEFFSSSPDFEKLEQLCTLVASGRRTGGWLSEEGDLELRFATQPRGQVRISVICCPSVNLAYPGKLEFEVDVEMSAFDRLIMPK